MYDSMIFEKQKKSAIDALAILIADLQSAKSTLSKAGEIPGPRDRLYVDLVARTMSRAELIVLDRTVTFQMEFSDITEWLNDPLVAAAAICDVDVNSYMRWVEKVDSNSPKSVHIKCCHPKCKMTKPLRFESPKEMTLAEAHAAAGIWYCSHHRSLAWSNQREISDDLSAILIKVQGSPGCNKADLIDGANKLELEFLCLIGLLKVRTVGRQYEFYLTDTGTNYIRTKGRS